MTFLELCKFTRQECGIQGSNLPSAVTSQTGLLLRVVNWVQDADLLIQRSHPDWNFLWSQYRVNTVENSDTLAKPDDFGQWDHDTFGVDRGTSNGRKLTKITFDQWRSNYNLKQNSEPYAIAVAPDNSLRLQQPADGIYEVYGEYWKSAVKMTADEDSPLYPERFHRAIIARAKMWFFEDIESTDQWKQAREEFDDVLSDLESFALPNQQIGSQSSPSDPLVVRTP